MMPMNEARKVYGKRKKNELRCERRNVAFSVDEEFKG